MKRKDGLEEFINNNRQDFDDAYPSLKSWAEIERRLDRGSGEVAGVSSVNKKVVTFVVVVLLSIIAGLLFYINNEKIESPKNMLFAEVESLEHFYQLKTNKMIKTVSNDFEVLSNPDLEEIDIYINEIKQELGDMPKGSEDKALNALLESYRTKLMIIERILQQHELSQPADTDENNYDI